MKILTIGASPYILTKEGRIHRDVIVSATKAGHYVEALVWHHDVSFFLPNELQEHHFIHNKEKLCRIHPFPDERGGLPMAAYETMKKVQPSVVITVGAAHESTDIWSVKALYPHLFKWIMVLTEGSSVINENYKEQLGYANIILATSKTGVKAARRITNVPVEYLPYGPDRSQYFEDGERPKEFGIIVSAKNSQMSNVTAVLKGISDCDGMEGYLHTNIDDDGDSDLRLLLRRWGSADRIGLPDNNFVSYREGIPDTSMNQLYNRYHAVADVSMQSATALTMLEAMSTGCVPVGVNFGAVGEVISQMPPEFRFVVEPTMLIGPREEEYAVVSSQALSSVLKFMSEAFLSNGNWFATAKEKSKEVATVFSKEHFVNRLNDEIDRTNSYDHAIVVDSF